MSRRFPKFFLFLLVLVIPTLCAGILPAATPQEYDRALGSVQAALTEHSQALDAQVISHGPSPTLAAQQELGPIHAVGAPGHAPTLVDTSSLIQAIQSAEALKNPDSQSAALTDVSHQISLLRRALALTPTRTDPAALTASARAVLAGPEFGSDPPPSPSLADRLAAWIDRLFRRRSTPRSGSTNISPKIILGILIVIAAAAFAVLVSVLVQAIGRRDARARPLALDAEEAVLMEARDNDSLLALAEAQAKAGDYRRAFRLVYLASLVALDTDGVLHFDRSKTNWEYLRALRTAGRGDVYAALTPLTREFDQVWYGFAPTDASQYSRALAQYHALRAVPAGAAAH